MGHESRGSHRYAVLDGLRGLAALCVVLFHAGGRRFVPGGYLAVDFFFALSGFVIAFAYEDRLAAGLTSRRFMLLRLARLYPLYLLSILLGVLLDLSSLVAPTAQYPVPRILHSPAFAAAALVELFFLPAPLPPAYILYPLNGAMWSLLYELLVNFVWARFLRRLGVPGLVACAAMAAVVLAYYVVTVGTVALGTTAPLFFGGFARAIYSFSAGVLVYRYRNAFPTGPGVLVAMLIFIVAVACPVPRGVLRAGWDIGWILVGFPLLVGLGGRTQNGARWTGTLLLAGAISYPLYALHLPVLRFAAGPLPQLIGKLPHWRIAAIVATVLLSIWVEKVYDRPLRRWLTRLVQSRAGTPTA